MRRLLPDHRQEARLGDVTTLRDPGVMKDLQDSWEGEECVGLARADRTRLVGVHHGLYSVA